MMIRTKKKITPLLIFMLLTSLACSFADLTIAGDALHASFSPALATVTPTVCPTQTIISPTATVQTVYTVCTGVPEGKLYVRSNAGTDCAVVTYLNEGDQVLATEEIAFVDGSHWLHLVEPDGWINARYICLYPNTNQINGEKR